MQRNFEPMRKQVEEWQRSELTPVSAKVVIYEAFVEGKLEAPKHLARTVHDLYFEPKYEEFRSRTIWSLSNAFTSAFKELEPIPNLRQQRSWESSWGVGSHRLFDDARRCRPDRRCVIAPFFQNDHEKHVARVSAIGESRVSYFESSDLHLKLKLRAFGFSEIEELGPREICSRYFPSQSRTAGDLARGL